MTKRISKNTGRTYRLAFPPEMYNNVYGSVAVSYAILNDLSIKEKKRLGKRFLELSKDPDGLIDFVWDDPEFIQKDLALFGLKYTDEFKSCLCMVKSRFNVLFAPYLENANQPELSRPLPLREDGFMGTTLSSGEVTYPL